MVGEVTGVSVRATICAADKEFGSISELSRVNWGSGTGTAFS